MIYCNDICLSFGKQKIFDHLSFSCSHHDRIGLVGRNGSGKSTLLAALQNPCILDSGTVSMVHQKKIGYMPQEVVLESSATILEETMQAFSDLHLIKKQLEALEPSLNTQQITILDRYSTLQEKLSSFNEESLRAQAKKMLMGLGFTQAQFDQRVNTLSVGWKMRIVLAKLLLQNADFYFFDEPTNHLDLMTKEWFLQFLKQSSFGFLIVCHERYFLDELVTHILELEHGKGTLFTGNYASYLIQKENAQQRVQAAYEQQQKEIKQKMATIERFRAKASKAKMAQSMLKAVEKIELITIAPQQKNVAFSFPPLDPSGNLVLKTHDVSYAFGPKLIFEHASFTIQRGEKVAIIAPNGGGKTTLLNVITKSLPLQKGTIEFGHNVRTATFAQDQQAVLNGNATILENVKECCPQKKEQEIRTMLGAFLFTHDDVYKLVKVLSGGEKNRVGMATVLLTNANLLLLDEPTNHLDIQSKELLLKALSQYRGTILFVSHDRDFVNGLSSHIIELTPHGAFKYEGNYDSYLFQKKMVQPTAYPNKKIPTDPEKIAPPVAKDLFELKKLNQKIEKKIEKIEAEIRAVQNSFAELVYGTPKFAQAEQTLKKLKEELESLLDEWEKIQGQLN